MSVLRVFILLVSVWGVMSQVQKCDFAGDSIADLVKMRERIDLMINLLEKYTAEKKVTEPPKPVTIAKATTTTTEPPPAPTTTTTEPPPPPTTTTTEPPPPPTTTEPPPPTTTTTEPPPPPTTTTTEPPPPPKTTTTEPPPPPTTTTTEPPPPPTTTTTEPPPPTTTTAEPPPPPTTTTTEPPPPTTTTTEPPPPPTTTTTEPPPPPTTTTTEPPPPPTTTTTEPPPPTTTTTEPPPPTTTTTEPPPPPTTTTTEPPPPPTTDNVPMVPILNDCKQIQKAGFKWSGAYSIWVPSLSRPVSVYCDMNTDGGGWTVFQRRLDGSINFNRSYAEYARGFGDVEDEFWLGNDVISALTKQAPNELRIDMSDWDDDEMYAKYSRFVVDGPERAYKMSLGKYQGTSGDSFGYHDGSMFSTFDADNDAAYTRHCAKSHTGGWWFRNCMRSNLNGLYIKGGKYKNFPDGVEWSRFRGLRYSMMFTEMKMRPLV